MSVSSQHTDASANGKYDLIVAERRAALTRLYASLPPYGSRAFWRIIEETDGNACLPLEVLVKCTRLAIAHQDHEGRNRIIEVIFRRTAAANEYWANSILMQTSLSADERKAFRSDLYADLCECVIRAILDERRSFWEENFQHSLLFERKHVFSSFMKREGRWWNRDEKRTLRVPRTHIQSLDQHLQPFDGNSYEDKLAQKALYADLLQLIVYLPDKLKSVLYLIFWEDKTEKDTARTLGITDRTVRNRLRAALKILQEQLALEREYANG